MERKHEAQTSLLSGSPSEHSYAPSGLNSMDRANTYQAGGYHQREGFSTSRTADHPKRRPLLYIPQSKWQYMFSGACVFQTIVALALEGYIFAQFQSDLTPKAHRSGHDSVTRIVATYLSLFIFGFLYQLVLVYDALRLKNTIQIIGLCLYNLGLLIEAAVQYDQIQDAFRNYSAQPETDRSDISEENADLITTNFWAHAKPIAITMPIFVAVISMILGYIAYKLYDEFAWSIYKHISADLRLRRRYLSYQIYIALLKFDFFFFLAFTVQFLVVVPTNTSTEHVEFGLTAAAIPVTIALLFLAAFWARREFLWGMLSIIVVYLGGLAYFCFKLFRMYLSNPGRIAEYRPARHSLTTFAILTIVLLVVTVIYAVICTMNFNKGLKPHIMSDRQRRKRANSTDLDKLVGGANDVPLNNTGPSRMTID